jgi:hypothetical protein
VALAAASRWEDFGILRREQLLPGIVQQGLVSKSISVGQACALAALIDSEERGILGTIFDANQHEAKASKRDEVAEILAWDDLFRFGRGYSDKLAKKLEEGGVCAGQGPLDEGLESDRLVHIRAESTGS